MGSTGKVGEFRIKINNDNNKYFVEDDINYEVDLLKAGQIVVATRETTTDEGEVIIENITYETLPVDLTWGTGYDFLNNRVYDRVKSGLEGDPDSPIYLYYQDPSEKYDIQVLRTIEQDTSILQALCRGKIKYRVIPSKKLEEFAKTDIEAPIKSGVSPSTPDCDIEEPSLGIDIPPGGEQEDLFGLSAFSPGTSPIVSSDSQTKEQTPVTAKTKDSDSSAPGYTSIVTLNEAEAVKLFQTSEVQAAFFEKYGGQLEHGRSVFEPMQLCAVFMRRRFRDDDDADDMVLSFVGYVDSVSDGFSGGTKHEINIVGSDVTKLMHITQANINPTLFTRKLPFSPNFKIWQHRFADLEGWEIIKLLTVGGVYEGDIIYGAGQFEVVAEGKPGATRFGSIFKDNVSTTTLLSSFPRTTTESEGDEPDIIERLLFNKKKLHIQTLPFDNSPVSSLQDFNVYKKIFGMSFGNWQNEYQSHLEIANMVAVQTNYEFYADNAGDIWYHQPRYHNYHILVDEVPEIYILRDEDILNANFTESDASVITSVYLTGQPNYYKGNLVPIKMVGFYEDPTLVMKYGRRMLTFSHPYVVKEGDLNYFARSYLQRVNQGRFTGTVTLIGRPEIRMHMPVYIPYRNLIFYVVGITHTLTMGKQFQTVLTLKYGRKPWEVLPEIFDYNHRANPGMVAYGKRHDHKKTVAEKLAKKEKEKNASINPGRAETEHSIADKIEDTSSKGTTDEANTEEKRAVTEKSYYIDSEGVARDKKTRKHIIILDPNPDIPKTGDEPC